MSGAAEQDLASGLASDAGLTHGVAARTPRALVASPDYAFALVAAIVTFALFIFMPAVLNDGDTYSHLAAGQWMLAHGAVPATDPFSYSFAGAPWVAHEWLAELLSALAFRLAGWSGLVMLFGVGAALTAGLLAAHLRRWLTLPATLLTLVLGLACVAPSMLARPHMLALPAVELWTAGLLIARAKGEAPGWWLLPVMTVWANLHGSFPFGLALTGPLALEAVLAERSGRMKVAARWAAFLLAAVAATLLTPHGLEGLLFPFQLMHMSMLSEIGEWAPTSFRTAQPMEFAAAALLFVVMTRGIRLPVIRLLLLFGLTYLALQHGRHQMLLGIVGALLVAQPLGEALRAGVDNADALPPRPDERRRLGWAVIAMVGIAFGAARIVWPVTPTDRPTAPITALAHVPASILAQPVFNDYDFGGYLIYRGIPPLIDGRADMYGDAFLALYRRATHPDRAALDELVDRYHIGWSILAPSNPAVALLDVLPGWHRIYADSEAVVHVRDRVAP